ncbi:glycosyltransferase family 4 protein [Paenibacillus cisolokensis]|nr:glycosyltransferase family 4 protein [Paenibacillus sp. 32O-W]
MKPKIAFVTPGSFPLPSSSSSSVERVVEELVPLLPPDVEPRIYGRTGRGLPAAGLLRGVRCERYPAADKRQYVRSVARSVRRFKPKVIQVENRPSYAVRLKKSNPRARLWINLHSSTFIGKRYISGTALRRGFRSASKIIVNSDYLRQIVARKVPEAASKLRVVHLGVDVNRFRSRFSPEGKARRERLRRRKGWEGRKVILFVGRLIPIKGVHHLFAALPELIAKHPKLLLVVVGSPFYGSHRTTPYSRKLRRMGKKHPAHVQFVPYVPHTKVPDWFLAADIAVVPSGKREAFGLVNVEAMATGLPVVATRAGGMKEIVRDGKTGYLLDPDRIVAQLRDKLHRLLQDDELCRTMGRNSRERVEQHFTWRHAADRWLALLREDGLL